MKPDRELADRWVLGLRQVLIESARRDGPPTYIVFADGRRLMIGGDATIAATPTVESPRRDLDDISDGDLESLVGQHVLSAVAFKTGALRIVLSSGATLRVSADLHYEAWELRSSSDAMLISIPGGGLSHWPRPSVT